MKKFILLVVVALLVAAPVIGNAQMYKTKDQAVALQLSSKIIPGSGEWYNNDFRGPFPWGECIVGAICPCVRISSVFDAVAGKTDSKMRFDFWTPPAR